MEYEIGEVQEIVVKGERRKNIICIKTKKKIIIDGFGKSEWQV